MHCQIQEFLFIVQTKVQIEKKSYPIYKIYKTLNKQFESTLLLGLCFSINYINIIEEFAVWNLVLDLELFIRCLFFTLQAYDHRTLVSHYLFFNFFFRYSCSPLNNYTTLIALVIVFCLTPHYNIVTTLYIKCKQKAKETKILPKWFVENLY